jgi:hypothetical protein
MPEQQYETISKFDKAYGGLVAGNNLHTKPTTIQELNFIGESETFIVQTIRITDGKERGDHVVISFVDKEGTKRLILPPRVTNAILRQKNSLTARNRSNVSRAVAKARMLAGELPGFMRNKKGPE